MKGSLLHKMSDLGDDIERLKELKMKNETELKLMLKELKHKYGIDSIEDAIKTAKELDSELTKNEKKYNKMIDDLAEEIDEILSI